VHQAGEDPGREFALRQGSPDWFSVRYGTGT
jgi:hypothetical protein